MRCERLRKPGTQLPKFRGSLQGFFPIYMDNTPSSQSTDASQDASPFTPEGDERVLKIEDFDTFLVYFRKRYVFLGDAGYSNVASISTQALSCLSVRLQGVSYTLKGTGESWTRQRKSTNTIANSSPTKSTFT